jgi:hypothetical protein
MTRDARLAVITTHDEYRNEQQGRESESQSQSQSQSEASNTIALFGTHIITLVTQLNRGN